MSDPRLLIDSNYLDEELINNPSFIQEVCDEAAEAIAHRDAMKEALDTIDAELDAELRASKAAGLVTAAETRSKAIESLSRLYASGYFAIDSTKKSASSQELQYNKNRETLANQRSRGR